MSFVHFSYTEASHKKKKQLRSTASNPNLTVANPHRLGLTSSNTGQLGSKKLKTKTTKLSK